MFLLQEQMGNPGLPLKSSDKKCIAKRNNFHFAPLRRPKYNGGTYMTVVSRQIGLVIFL